MCLCNDSVSCDAKPGGVASDDATHTQYCKRAYTIVYGAYQHHLNVALNYYHQYQVFDSINI